MCQSPLEEVQHNQVQLLCLGHNDLKQHHRLGKVWLESCLAEKNLGVLVNICWTWASVCAHMAKRVSDTLVWISKSVASEMREEITHSSVLRTGEATPWTLCSVLGPRLQDRDWGARASPEKGKASEVSGEAAA